MKKNFLPELPDLTRVRALVPFGSDGSTSKLERRSLRSALRRGGDLGPADRLALTEVRGSLTFTANTVTAWFTLAEQVWPFKADGHREQLIAAVAGQYAGLGGMQLHLRRTSVPFPIEQWAHDLEANAEPLPDLIYEREDRSLQSGARPVMPTWRQHISDARARLTEGQYASGRTQLGITLPRPAGLSRLGKRGAGEAADAAIIERFTEIAEQLSAHGMKARPSGTAELLWLIYRSVGIGVTPPVHAAGDVGPEDITEFADAVDFERSRYSATTKITDRRTGQEIHVAVLTVGRMEELTIPQVHQPWAHLSEQADFPVEWSSRIDILSNDASRGPLERQLLMIRSQQRDYGDHSLDEPPHLERLAQRASQVGDQIDTGLPVDSARAHGWHRMAVYGDTPEQCLLRVRELTRLYDEHAHMQLVSPKGQYHLLREFIPGEPRANTGYLRRMPVTMLAAAMPQATASVGDSRGDLIGHTATSGERPVFWDPHYPMEVRERSGLSVFVAEPGGGKSTLMGALGYLNARRGVQVTLMDPSGPLAKLCRMPELAPYSRVVDLAGSQPGTLAPYAMIPTPLRASYDPDPAGEKEYEQAIGLSRAERNALVLDICRMLLPTQILASESTEIVLREALRMVAPEETSTLDDVVAALHAIATSRQNAHAAALGDLLDDNRRLPQARVFFGSPPPGTLSTDAVLTVITLGGLRLPDLSTDRRDWSVEESVAVPMLHVAHRLAVRRSYTGDPHARKMVGLDEAHVLTEWASGRSFLIRLARDSRKWNLAALLASQNPADILNLGVQNLLSTVFVGRIADDEDIAAGALKMLSVPAGAGYEATLAGLSQHADTASTARLGFREFVMRDVDNRVQKIRIDVSYVRGLLDALDTTPGGTR